MDLSNFDFELDKKFIANSPAVPRDSSKLMIYDSKKDVVIHDVFSNIGNYLSKDDMLVVNSSKVVRARLVFDGNKELFLLKKLEDGDFEALVRPGKYFKEGKTIQIDTNLTAEVLSVNPDGTRTIKFKCAKNLDEYLQEIGEIPLPPYIENPNIKESEYQTVYAKQNGSVAAPTAGLHFTPELIAGLKASGISFQEVMLHVGRGTFLPISAEKIEDHVMHEEIFELKLETAVHINDHVKTEKRLIAIGTTSVRVLESCFVPGSGYLPKFGETKIFIYPRHHEWSPIGGLITNFHLPKSTLLLLVASFLENKGVKNPGQKLLELYETAKTENYRFFSFGDGMLIL